VKWLVGGFAEIWVAYRENWQIGRISRNGWLVVALGMAALITLLVVAVG